MKSLKCAFHATDVKLIATTGSTTPVVGQQLIIYCNLNTTLSNITASVNLKLTRNDITIYEWNRSTITAPLMSATEINSENYVINMLNTSVDGSTFQCEAIINATSILKITSSFLLKVTGELLAMH